jgi:hypothetical protein
MIGKFKAKCGGIGKATQRGRERTTAENNSQCELWPLTMTMTVANGKWPMAELSYMLHVSE